MRKHVAIGAIAAALFVAFALQAAEVLDNSGPVTFFIEDGKSVPGYQDSDRDLAKMAFEAWSRESAGKLKFVETKVRNAALVRIQWISPNEGLFGETQRIVVNGKPGGLVYVMPQVAQLGPLGRQTIQDGLLRDTIVYLTCVHELGHAVGLEHTRKFEDIMYFFGFGGDIVEYFMRYRGKLQSRADIGKYSGLSAGDVDTLLKLYPHSVVSQRFEGQRP
jgi:hypothetical protein